jgi:signal transduction histidine kinase
MKVNEQQQKHHQADQRHPWWHSLFPGYLLAVLFAASAFLIPLSERSLGIQDFFIEPPFVMATLLIGSFWGIGPALLALLLEVLALDYWIVSPVGMIDFFRWPDLASFAPFILLQLIVLALVVTQKKYRQQLLRASQAASQQAEELAERNARLQQADQVKDQFLSMASHELRTPITGIQGQVQLLLRRLKRQSAQHPDWLPVYDTLSKVDEQTRRLTELVNALLDLNTLRSGKMPVCLAPCDMRRLCRQVVEEQQALAGRAMDLRLPADPVVIQADGRKLSEVVSNLLTNALKYSPANTLIRVEVSQRPAVVLPVIREALLAVHNEGPVLSKEQQETLFEPFYRSPEAHSSATPGWGLGLTICKEIVMQHSGRIWVESSQEQGTTFFVALPLPTSSESAELGNA